MVEIGVLGRYLSGDEKPTIIEEVKEVLEREGEIGKFEKERWNDSGAN